MGTSLKWGSSLSGYLTTPGKIDRQKADELRKRWHELFAGKETTGRTAVLEGGLEYEPLQPQTFDAMQLEEARKIATAAIAQLFQLPPSLIGGSEHVNRSSAETDQVSAFRLCLHPAAIRVSDQISRQILSPAQRSAGLRVQIDLRDWLRSSGASLADM